MTSPIIAEVTARLEAAEASLEAANVRNAYLEGVVEQLRKDVQLAAPETLERALKAEAALAEAEKRATANAMYMQANSANAWQERAEKAEAERDLWRKSFEAARAATKTIVEANWDKWSDALEELLMRTRSMHSFDASKGVQWTL